MPPPPPPRARCGARVKYPVTCPLVHIAHMPFLVHAARAECIWKEKCIDGGDDALANKHGGGAQLAALFYAFVISLIGWMMIRGSQQPYK